MSHAQKQKSGRSMAECSAEDLAVRAQGGGEAGLAAFGELVERFSGRVHSFLLRRLSSADAEDLTQEAFIRAWQRIGTYNPRYRFSTWIFTIATRLAISHGRTDRRGRERPLNADGGFRHKGTEPGAGMAAREERVRVWDVVEEVLSPEQQTAVWLRYVEDMAIADIARVMGRSQVGVRVMLFRARGVLSEHLEPPEEGEGASRTGVPVSVAGARCAGGAA